MAEVKLKEEQELWEPAEVDNRRIKEEPDCGGVQSPHEADLSLLQIKEEPKEVQIKQESSQVFPVTLFVRCVKVETLLHENREDRDGAEAEDWTPSAESPTPQTHAGEKPIRCSVCPKRFSENCELKRHMKTHTGEKRFRCSVCPKRFLENSALKTHMMTHTGEKPFKCPVCGKGFSQSYRKNHMMTHTGEKPFSCSFCPKRFSRNVALRSHLTTHTGEKPFRCSVCPKTFTLNSGLKRHMSSHFIRSVSLVQIPKY